MNTFKSVIVAVGVVGAVSVASAAPSPVPFGDAVYTSRLEPRTGEQPHDAILGFIYGGTFASTGAHGLDYTNGELYIQRVADDRTLTPTATAIGQVNGVGPYHDQFWQDQFSTVEAHARFGDYIQNFGLFPQRDGGDYVKLFDVVPWDYGLGVEGDAAVPDLQGETFRWARSGDNGVWNSHPGQNRDELDHLITYKVMTLNGQLALEVDPVKTFLLFWEDQSDTDNVNWYDVGDWDYNDLVVEVRAQYIPEPSAIAGVMGGLALLGLRRRR